MCEPKRFHHGLPGWHKEVGDREAAIAEATGANPGQGSVAALSDVRSTVSSAQSNQQEAGAPTPAPVPAPVLADDLVLRNLDWTCPPWAGLLDVVEGQSPVQYPPRKPARNVSSTVSSTQSSQVSSLLQPRKYLVPCQSGKMIIGICHY